MHTYLAQEPRWGETGLVATANTLIYDLLQAISSALKEFCEPAKKYAWRPGAMNQLPV